MTKTDSWQQKKYDLISGKFTQFVQLAPAYLANDCRLLSDIGRRPLRSNSNDMRKLLVPRTHNKLGDRSFSTVEQPFTRSTAVGTDLRLLQTISENSFI